MMTNGIYITISKIIYKCRKNVSSVFSSLHIISPRKRVSVVSVADLVFSSIWLAHYDYKTISCLTNLSITL